jgi:hypothetical protein
MKRKLQIFVSSTYTDLRAERQSAVEAILKAGHIPAGMKLFIAGDESQWQTIRRWIEKPVWPSTFHSAGRPFHPCRRM